MSLALSVDSCTDQPIIHQMEHLEKTMRQKLMQYFINSMNGIECSIQKTKHYTITKYFVKELKGVLLKER